MSFSSFTSLPSPTRTRKRTHPYQPHLPSLLLRACDLSTPHNPPHPKNSHNSPSISMYLITITIAIPSLSSPHTLVVSHRPPQSTTTNSINNNKLNQQQPTQLVQSSNQIILLSCDDAISFALHSTPWSDQDPSGTPHQYIIITIDLCHLWLRLDMNKNNNVVGATTDWSIKETCEFDVLVCVWMVVYN